MRGALRSGMCVALAWAAGLAAAGEGDAEALKKDLAALKEKVAAVEKKREALREEARKSPQAAELRAALDKAEAAYKEKRDADPAYAAATKADLEAAAAYDKLVREKLAANPDLAALTKERDALRAQMREIEKKLQ